MEVRHHHNGDNGGNTDTVLNIGNSLLGHTHTPSVLTPTANLGISKAHISELIENSAFLTVSGKANPEKSRVGKARRIPKKLSAVFCRWSPSWPPPLSPCANSHRAPSLALLPRICIGVPYSLPVRPTPVLQTFHGPAVYVGSKPITTLLIYPVWPTL